MAQRWSVKEDYIVCKYCHEHANGLLWEDELKELSGILVEQGFPQRSLVAISKRVREFSNLFFGEPSPYLNEQISSVFSSFMERRQNRGTQERIKSYIKETYNPDATNDEVIDSSLASSLNLTGAPSHHNLIRKINYEDTFPMVMQRLLDKKGFRKYTEVYRLISMPQDTFSSILRGKWNAIKKETAFKLCIGMKLTLEESIEFLNSASLSFSSGDLLDVIVKAFIVNKCYDPFAIDDELEENGVKVLFSLD